LIARSRGRILEKHPDHVVVDAGGVGYRVFVSLTTLTSLGEAGAEADLRIHTQVREDAFQLFGFATDREREAFRELIQVKGVGPKVARTILGVPADDLAQAILTKDTAYLKRIPGVGAKMAERLTVELRDKLGSVDATISFSGGAPGDSPVAMNGGVLGDLGRALAALGYRPNQVTSVLKRLKPKAEEGADLQDLIREALKVVR
jgi:Holliday junction DNA helicase RuvA